MLMSWISTRLDTCTAYFRPTRACGCVSRRSTTRQLAWCRSRRHHCLFFFNEEDSGQYAATGAGELFRPRSLPAGIWLQLDEFSGSPVHGDVKCLRRGRAASKMIVLPASDGGHIQVAQFGESCDYALRLHSDARQLPHIDGGARLHNQAGRHNRLCAASAAGPTGSSWRLLVVSLLCHVIQGHADARHALAAASDKGVLRATWTHRASACKVQDQAAQHRTGGHRAGGAARLRAASVGCSA